MLRQAVNLAFIAEVGDGILIPVLNSADRLSLAEPAAGRRPLTAAATIGGLGPKDLMKGTFTVPDFGPLGARSAHREGVALQAAVRAVGSISGSEVLMLSRAAPTASSKARRPHGSSPIWERLSGRAWPTSADLNRKAAA
jgi:pyruvate/2-oxoglutarate dehydrogenase complex dihydrolipoamide acyltransferase (E2) component